MRNCSIAGEVRVSTRQGVADRPVLCDGRLRPRRERREVSDEMGAVDQPAVHLNEDTVSGRSRDGPVEIAIRGYCSADVAKPRAVPKACQFANRGIELGQDSPW